MGKVLLISFDAVGNPEFDRLMEYPNFSRLAKKSTVVRNADSLFVSNTYPIHASIATGVHPGRHGLVSNVEPFPEKDKTWHFAASGIRAKTLWQAAGEKGLKSAAVLWPVTGGAKEIRWNIPEVAAKPGESQVLVSLKSGSKLLQLKAYLRHRKLMDGLKQPNLDEFSTACMADILREHRPDLTLMHLTCYDTLCHLHGRGTPELETAFASLDRSLGILLEAAGEDTTVIVFSDHNQLNVHTSLPANDWLVELGLLNKEKGLYGMGQRQCFIECCGGSAFLHGGTLSTQEIASLKENFQKRKGFGRFLTPEEMAVSGYGRLPFGFSAARGYSFDAYPGEEKANHGYPLDEEDYQVFYMIKGPRFGEDRVLNGGCILQVTALAAGELGLGMPDIEPPHPGI